MATEKGIHAGHRDRVKKRAMEEGIESFEDHQILELLLFYCIPQKDTNEIAHKMLREFGSLHKLFDATVDDIQKRCNVTQNIALFITIMPSLFKRYNLTRWNKKEVFDTSKKAGQYCINLVSDLKIECFYLLCFDTAKRLIHALRIFEGTVSEAPIYPREIVKAAVKYNAVSVMLCHNHPGGILSPSKSDIDATSVIIDSLDAVGVEVVDHIIVAEDKYYSFCENKTLPLWY